MKIRLTLDLPIDKKHGATAGRVFEVVRQDLMGRSRRVFFVGDVGRECAALTHEYEAVHDTDARGSVKE